MGMSHLLATAMARRMPPGLEVFIVRIENVSVGVKLGVATHDAYRIPLNDVAAYMRLPYVGTMSRASLHDTLVGPLAARAIRAVEEFIAARASPPPVEVEDFDDGDLDPAGAPVVHDITAPARELLGALKSLEYQRAMELSSPRSPVGYSPELMHLINVMRKLSNLKCATCACNLTVQAAMVTSCCSASVCRDHAAGPCGFCETEGGPSSPEEVAPVTSDSVEWIRNAMRGLRSTSFNYRSAARRSMEILSRSGRRCVLVLCSMWGNGANAVAKKESIAKIKGVVKDAAGGACVETVCTDAGVMLTRGARDRVIKQFQHGAGDGIKVLMLHHSSGQDEQIVGLDLGFVDAILKMGTMSAEDDQQLNSRLLRAGAPNQTENKIIINIEARF